MTKMTKIGAVTLAAVALVLAGCTEQPSDDRPDAAADAYKDATKVTIWRNADGVPNVAIFCADGLRFAATLSSDGAKQPQLVRVPEGDDICAGR